MPTYLWWALAINAAELFVIVVLVMYLVHYARERGKAEGKNEVHERIFEEGKTISIGGR